MKPMVSESVIPPNARVIEWTDWSGHIWVAARSKPEHAFTVLGQDRSLTEEDAAKHSPRVLATFPAPTLAEIVGDAPAFVAQGKGGKRPVIYWRTARDGWHFAPVDGAVHPSDPDAQVGRNWYEDMLSDYIDLSTVVPLVPRGES